MMQQLPGNLTPRGYEKVTGLSSAKALTVPTGARVARIQAETQSVRYRDDGTNPTGTDGMEIAAGEAGTILYDGSLANIRLIETAASATVHVLYYG